MAYRQVPLEVFKVSQLLQNNIIYKKGSKALYSVTNLTMGQRNIFQEYVTRNLELLSNDKLTIEKNAGKVPILRTEKSRPLAVMFEWISADKKHFHKYSDIYLERGYDVLAVSLSVRQLLWPTSGSQIVAGETLEFLNENPVFNPLLLHGFSIGGYLWGEVLVLMDQNVPKYQPLINRIKGQIWDSTPDAAGFYKGFPKAIFPNNALLRLAVEKSIVYHLRIFHDSATKHYLKASELFHNTPVKAPALLLIAKNDVVASYKSVLKLKDDWDAAGMKTRLKSWEKSKHVSHLRFHKEEYIDSLNTFLSSLNEQEQREDKESSETVHAKL